MRGSIRAFLVLSLLIGIGAFTVTLLAERQKSMDLSDALADMERSMSDQVSDLQQQVDAAKARSESAELALTQARELLARSDDQHRSDQAAAAEIDAKLQTERQRTAVLADKLAETDHRAVTQATDLQRALMAEQARAASLGKSLEEARRGLSDVEDRQRSAQAEAAQAEAAAQQRTAALGAELADARRRWALETKELQERFENEQTRAASLEQDLAQARQMPPPSPKAPDDAQQGETAGLQPGIVSEPDRQPATNRTPSLDTRSSSDLPASKPASSVRLPPDGVPARVVLRYASGSEAAKARVQTVEQILLKQGMLIEDHATSAKGLSASRITYFYEEDQAIAKTIAEALARLTGAGALQRSPPSTKPLPRPGTIEIAISG